MSVVNAVLFETSGLLLNGVLLGNTGLVQVPMQGDTSMLMSLGMLVLFCLVFYFLLIRPQQKRQKEQVAKIAALEVGSRVMLGGGLIGTLVARGDTEDTIELAPGVQIQVAKAGVVAEAPASADDDAPRYDPAEDEAYADDADLEAQDTDSEELASEETYREIPVQRTDDDRDLDLADDPDVAPGRDESQR